MSHHRPPATLPSFPARSTIADVARAAGVSVSTVSRVINGKGEVAPDTAEAVRRAMAAVDYRVSPVARSLVGARTRLLAVHGRHLTDDYASAVVRGVVAAAEAAGYGLLLATAGPAAELLRTLPDGVIVLSPSVADDDRSAGPEPGRPTVVVEPLEADTTAVGVSAANRDGELAAMRYLLRLGHRRIGFVAGTPSFSSSHERLAAYRAALAEAGVVPDPALVAIGHNDRDSGRVAGARLLGLRPGPTAIVASNDLMAVGILSAARDAGVRVPDDCSVVGFDDAASAQHTYPALTTVRQPLEEMGRTATAMLLGWLASGERPDPPRVVLPTELVVRASCATARGG